MAFIILQVREMKRQRKIYLNRIVAFVLAISISTVQLSVCPWFETEAYASDRMLSLKAAEAIAVENSDKVFKYENAVQTKESAYKSAVKSVAIKKKDLATFRYSPLLSFKFPKQPNMAQAFEFEFKPIDAKMEIDRARHTLNDSYFEVYDNVRQLFVEIVGLQKRLDFNTERLNALKENLKKNKARLAAGNAKPEDIEKLERIVGDLENSISGDMGSIEKAKKKLGTLLGINVSTGYKFEDPCKEADIPREALKELTEYTLDNSNMFYDAAITERLAYMRLDVYDRLLSSNYPRKYYNIIAPYIRQARAGQKINARGFKKDYDNFVNIVDSPWWGDYKIYIFFFIYIRIPKELFKGDLDGARYMEDDPYALMTSASEYVDAKLEKDATEAEIRQQVEENYNNCQSLRRAYLNYMSQIDNAREGLKKNSVRNLIGELTFEEYVSEQEDLSKLQQDAIDTLKSYSSALFAFDRLACGGVSKYLSGNSDRMYASGDGISTVEENVENGPKYFINMIVQRNLFEFSIDIPDKFPVKVTDYELYIDNYKVGGKTPAAEPIRHLGLDFDKVSTAKVRFYNGDAMVCDSEIDPYSYSGPLNIISGYSVTTADNNELGSYSAVQDSASAHTRITITPNENSEIAGYKLRAGNGAFIGGDKITKCSNSFMYLTILSADLGTVDILFYDKDDKFLYEGYFDTNNSKVKKKPE